MLNCLLIFFYKIRYLNSNLKAQGNTLLAKGKLEQAKTLYFYYSKDKPNDAEGYVNLAFVLIQLSQYEEAQSYLLKSIAINPNQADAYYLLGVVCEKKEDIQQAINNYQIALKLNKTLEMPHHHLYELYINNNALVVAKNVLMSSAAINPDLAVAQYYAGNIHLAENASSLAMECFQKALLIEPDNELIYFQIGITYHQQNNVLLAEESYRKAIALNGDYINAYNNLAYVLQEQDKIEDAISLCKQVLINHPDSELINFQLGNFYQKQKKLDMAVDAYQKTISINENFVEAYNNLGCVLQEQNRLKEAIVAYKKGININPNNAQLHNNIGAVMQKSKDFQNAVASFKNAIEINPNLIDAHNNIARAYMDLFNFEQAIVHYEKVLALGGDNASVVNDLATALRRPGNLDKAIELYRRALSIPSDFKTTNVTHSNLLFSLSCFNECSPNQYLEEAKSYGSRVLEQATPYHTWLVDMDVNVHRPLRVGFVSGDLHRHPVGFFINHTLASINKKNIELFVYTTTDKEDELTTKIKSHVNEWQNIMEMSDECAAKQIHDDRVDILIDLSGHTSGNRLSLFAWKPAPVQISWLGYWASTGVPGIDYLLADSVSVPEEHQADFSETIWYLPDTRMCFTQPSGSDVSMVANLPALTNQYITFGSFQNPTKMDMSVFTLWSNVLQAIPTAKLRLQTRELEDNNIRTSILEKLSSLGIDTNRVMMKGGQLYHEYLASYSEVDIVLDTFPFPGGTTTCEALWMGVPTVTLAGQTLLSRQGASMLTCAGLADWAANSEAEYVETAIKKASDIEGLAKLRSMLRQQVQNSPLFDAQLFARNLDHALHQIWEATLTKRHLEQ